MVRVWDLVPGKALVKAVVVASEKARAAVPEAVCISLARGLIRRLW
jgi:hypothetical protein